MIDQNNLIVWVLSPLVKNKDENIDYYYDFNQSILEYTKVFNDLNIIWKWQPITIYNFKNIIETIKTEAVFSNTTPLFFNLCDGDETNGAPGISVIKYLEELQLIYTGADEYFYKITTSKADMKAAFDKYNVANANWKFINSINDIEDNIFEQIGTPIILKPSVSGGSMGVGIKNVVHNLAELKTQVSLMLLGYRGWNLNLGGIIAEHFINGPEFTVLITGNYFEPEKAVIYEPVERVFHSSLSDEEKILSFDRYWEIYEEESPMPNGENFYVYQLPKAIIIEELKQISWNAYVACKGKGYTRIDIRQDAKTEKFYILEVNAQCGLSEDENYTSIGAILRYSNSTFTCLIKEIIEHSLHKNLVEK